MNTPEDQPPQLSPEEATLESELKRLRPAPVSSSIRQRALGSLESADLSADDHALAERLTSLRPAAPSKDLWASISSQLDEAPPSKVITVPQWRDFAPIFNVAAMVAVGLFAAALILKPSSNSESPSAASPEGLSGQPIPISHTGTKNSTRIRFMEKDNRVYEERKQTRKDRTRYKLGQDLHAEDEVTLEKNVYSPIKSF